jgi:hypothetical protein
VKLSAGVLAAAGVGASDETLEVGTMDVPAFASGDKVAVVLRNCEGTCFMVASAAISAGVAVYGAASGKIATTVSGTAIGISMEAAAADGDLIEVERY